MFHARVLLAESDVTSAEKMKEILEYAGYVVTVEGNGKQVRQEGKREEKKNINELDANHWMSHFRGGGRCFEHLEYFTLES